MLLLLYNTDQLKSRNGFSFTDIKTKAKKGEILQHSSLPMLVSGGGRKETATQKEMTSSSPPKQHQHHHHQHHHQQHDGVIVNGTGNSSSGCSSNGSNGSAGNKLVNRLGLSTLTLRPRWRVMVLGHQSVGKSGKQSDLLFLDCNHNNP